MNLFNKIRKLFCNSFVVRICRLLRISIFLKYIYYFLIVARRQEKSFCFQEIIARFHIKNPQEVPFYLAKGFPMVGERFVLNKLLQVVSAGNVFYDIGASIGSHTIFIAKKVGKNGKVIAFEPESNSFEVLQANVILNDLRNVILMPVALGDKIEDKLIYSHGDGLGAFNLVGSGNSLREEIKIVPGDMLVQEKKFPIPKVVKIDVEGYEYAVIMGLKKTLSSEVCQMVCCEIHPTLLPSNIEPSVVIGSLKSYGFNRIETHPRGETFHVFCYKV